MNKVNNNVRMRSQSVGGLGAINQQQLNEVRNLFMHDKKEEGKDTPEDELNRNIMTVDESGKVVNYMINPPTPQMTKDNFTDWLKNIKQNKLVQV